MSGMGWNVKARVLHEPVGVDKETPVEDNPQGAASALHEKVLPI
jgi:hypothetical protein